MRFLHCRQAMMLGIVVGMTREGQFVATQWPPLQGGFCKNLQHFQRERVHSAPDQWHVHGLLCWYLCIFAVFPSACRHAGMPSTIGGFAAVAALIVDLGSFMYKACFAGYDAFLCSLRCRHHGRCGRGRARCRQLWHAGLVLLVTMQLALCSLCFSAGPVTLHHGGTDQKDSNAVTSVLGPQTLH